MNQVARGAIRVTAIGVLILALSGAAVFAISRLTGSGGSEILDELARARDVVTRERVFDSPVEALPSVVHVDAQGRSVTASDVVVVGTFEEVNEGRGFSWDIDDLGEEIRLEHPYGDEQAWINTIHVTLRVEEVIDAAADQQVRPGELLTIGIALDHPVSLSAATNEMKGLGKVVVYLVRSAVYDYDPTVWAILEDGGFIGTVDQDGNISFQLLSADEGISGREGLNLTDLRRS